MSRGHLKSKMKTRRKIPTKPTRSYWRVRKRSSTDSRLAVMIATRTEDESDDDVYATCNETMLDRKNRELTFNGPHFSPLSLTIRDSFFFPAYVRLIAAPLRSSSIHKSSPPARLPATRIIS